MNQSSVSRGNGGNLSPFAPRSSRDYDAFAERKATLGEAGGQRHPSTSCRVGSVRINGILAPFIHSRRSIDGSETRLQESAGVLRGSGPIFALRASQKGERGLAKNANRPTFVDGGLPIRLMANFYNRRVKQNLRPLIQLSKPKSFQTARETP
jgi:hypothetical protein